MDQRDLELIKSKLPLSASTLARNGVSAPSQSSASVKVPDCSFLVTEGKRLRQDSKPIMNKLELAFLNVLRVEHANERIEAQAIRFKLANGIWYKPDFVIFSKSLCFEVKGPHAFRGGFENLKLAATQFPDFTWILVWKEEGHWKKQLILK